MKFVHMTHILLHNHGVRVEYFHMVCTVSAGGYNFMVLVVNKWGLVVLPQRFSTRPS